ncbi:MAG: SDR family oxidoreductase [Deltaproteobacteria bacterium]|nr:SDR family oxidoreductase [Deltaproteobacteria bacterium]
MPKPLVCSQALLDLDLGGKTYVVTGGNSGIGLVTVQQLAKQGARVILACRRPDEGARARDAILATSPRGSVEVIALDLAELASVRSFAQQYLAKNDALHGLVNNAGVMNTGHVKTKDGFDMQLGTNHLGHYLLTELLLPALRNAAPSRIVNVSSCYHDLAQGREGRIDFDDLHFERRPYDGWAAYAQSKLANVLHAKALATRLDGTGVVAVSVHPGWVRTNLVKSFMPVWLQDFVFRPFLSLAGMIEPWEGTQTTLHALLAPEVAHESGSFYSQLGMYRDKAANKGGWPMRSPNPNANDDVVASRLDAVSREFVGLATTA